MMVVLAGIAVFISGMLALYLTRGTERSIERPKQRERMKILGQGSGFLIGLAVPFLLWFISLFPPTNFLSGYWLLPLAFSLPYYFLLLHRGLFFVELGLGALTYLGAVIGGLLLIRRFRPRFFRFGLGFAFALVLWSMFELLMVLVAISALPPEY